MATEGALPPLREGLLLVTIGRGMKFAAAGAVLGGLGGDCRVNCDLDGETGDAKDCCFSTIGWFECPKERKKDLPLFKSFALGTCDWPVAVLKVSEKVSRNPGTNPE
jgi:hypothetical protein